MNKMEKRKEMDASWKKEKCDFDVAEYYCK